MSEITSLTPLEEGELVVPVTAEGATTQPVQEQGAAGAADPAALFAEHVALVRGQGDSLEAVRRYYTFPKVGGRMAVTVAATEAMLTAPEAAAACVTVAGTLVVAKTVQGHVAKKRAFARSQARFGSEAAEAVGERYELYRVRDSESGRGEVVMRWYGPPEPEDNDTSRTPSRPESLRKIAELADDNEIKAVFIAPTLLTRDLETAERLADARVDTKGWLHTKKQLRAQFKENGEKVNLEVLSYTPQSLRALAEQYGRRSETAPDLAAVISVLRSHVPEHPLIRTYDDYRADPAEQQARVQKHAKSCLERQLDDVAVYRELDANLAPQRQKAYLQGRLHGEFVRWETLEGKLERSEITKLLVSAGLTSESLQDILRNPGMYPARKVTQAAECAAYLAACMPPRQDTTETTEQAGDGSLSLQAGLVAAIYGGGKQPLYAEGSEKTTKVNMHEQRTAHKVVGVMMVAAALWGTFLDNKSMDNQKSDVYAASEVQYAHEHHLGGADDLSAEQAVEAHKHALDDHPLTSAYLSFKNGAWHALHAMEDVLPYAQHGFDWGSEPATNAGGGTSGVSHGVSNIGNVLQSPEDKRPEWNVRAAGDMSISGYWATDAGTELNAAGQWIDRAQFDGPLLIPQEIPAAQKDYIAVRQAYTDSLTQYLPTLSRDAEVSVRIPVLEGTVPVAANYGGLPVNLYESTNGTYVLYVPVHVVQDAPEGSKLAYWLAPAHKSNGPHAYSFAQIATRAHDHEAAQIRAAWDEVLPAADSTDGSKGQRLQDEIDYIKENFDYSYTPLSKDMVTQIAQDKFDGSDFIAAQLKSEQANCNVASTLVALDNPELNVAFGYHVDDGSDTALRAGEAHQWLVNDKGDILDPTPSQKDGTAVQGSGGGPSGETIGLGIAGLLAVAGAGVAIRKKTGRARAQRRLNRASVQQLNRAWQVAGMAAYAEQFDPDKLQEAPQDETHADALARLSKAHLHDGFVAGSMEMAMDATTSKNARRLLKRSLRTLRAVQKAGLAEAIQTEDQMDGLLK